MNSDELPVSLEKDQFQESAATGDPTRASAFKGERLLAARIDDMVAALVARWPDLAGARASRPL